MESQAVFEAETQAKNCVSIESPPCRVILLLLHQQLVGVLQCEQVVAAA